MMITGMTSGTAASLAAVPTWPNVARLCLRPTGPKK